MSSSDSEAFESADEDVIESKIPVKKVDIQSSKNNISDNTKLVEVSSKLEKDDEVTLEVTLSTKLENQNIPSEEVQNVRTVINTDPMKTSRSVVDNEKKVHEPTTDAINSNQKCVDPPASKLSSHSSCEFIEIDDVKEPCDSDPKADEDSWDFDAWEDDAEDFAVKSTTTHLKHSTCSTNTETINVKKSPPETVQENIEKPSEEDGWEFDDWGEDDVVTSLPDSDSNKDTKSKQSQQGVTSILDKISSPKEQESTNLGWTPWGGMVKLLSTATSHVSSVIESGIGVPNPEEIARSQHEENLKKREQGVVVDSRKDDKSMLLGNIMSGVSQIGNRVLTGGLDTLEGIGKKTMTILQENDPGLLNKRKMLGMMEKESPVLSQILREAKEKTEEAENNLKEIQKQRYKKQLHFETLFDDYHGLVHLEALEMLSQQSAFKLQALLAALSGMALSELEETLNEVKELCELPEMDNEDIDGLHAADELADKFKTSVEDLDIAVDFKDIVQCWSENISWLEDESQKSAQTIHDKALRCLAQTTAISINKMHKLAELLLIKDHHSTADEADSLVQITNVICWHLSGIASRFGNSLSQMDNKDEVNSLITSIFLEGSNSTSYVQNAFQLFIPILQMGAA